MHRSHPTAAGVRRRPFRAPPRLRRPRFRTRLVAQATLCALLVGCGGSPDADSAGSTPAIASSTTGGLGVAPSGPPRDACELIPAERIAAIVRAPVVTISDPGPRESSCGYADESGRYLYLDLTVYWTGGREMLSIVQMGTDIAARLMAEPGDEAVVDSIVRPGPVPGLGDTALFSDILPSYVLTGDVLLEMGMPLLPDARAHFRPLASTALERL